MLDLVISCSKIVLKIRYMIPFGLNKRKRISINGK